MLFPPQSNLDSRLPKRASVLPSCSLLRLDKNLLWIVAAFGSCTDKLRLAACSRSARSQLAGSELDLFDDEKLWRSLEQFRQLFLEWRVVGLNLDATDQCPARRENLSVVRRLRVKGVDKDLSFLFPPGQDGACSIRTLYLSGCSQLTDVSALGNCSALSSLDLRGCSELTDVSALGNCSALSTFSLNLTGCTGLTAHPLPPLVQTYVVDSR